MEHYEPGKKGYIVLGLLTAFIMFILLLVYVYQMNGENIPY